MLYKHYLIEVLYFFNLLNKLFLFLKNWVTTATIKTITTTLMSKLIYGDLKF